MTRLIAIASMLCALMMCVGCASGPSKEDVTRSKLGVQVRKPFNEQNFLDGGTINEKDAWGNELLWELEKGYWYYTLTVRSNGPDGLPYTHDDIIVQRSISVTTGPDDEGFSERLVRGLTRGAVKGVRQGLKEPVTTDTGKSAPAKK